MIDPNRLLIFDTTLRDGEQSPALQHDADGREQTRIVIQANGRKARRLATGRRTIAKRTKRLPAESLPLNWSGAATRTDGQAPLALTAAV